MYTILIVDDEANLLEVLAVALENMGYGTVTAETAEEALAVLEEREVHLVLSDLRLPGLSGRELMEKVKAANPDLPVVIMTAYASLKEAVEIIKEGAFDYTVKPFELDALEATIASALRYYALGRDNRDLREQLQTASAGQFVGQSPAYLALLRTSGKSRRAAPTCSSPANPAPARKSWPRPSTTAARGPKPPS